MRPPATLTGLFETACRWSGDAPRFVDPARRLSGPEAAAAARRSAAGLSRLGLRPGGIAAFLCGPSTDHLIAVFGTLAAGAAFCALHVRETEARLAAALAELRPDLLIANRSARERARARGEDAAD